METEAPSSVFPAFEDTEIANIYERYLDIKGALVASEKEMAIKSAEMFLTSVVAYPKLQKLGLALSKTADLSKQRLLFAELNEEFLNVIRKNQPVNGMIFVFRSQNAEYWMANEARVNNPYDGTKGNGALVEALGNK